MNTVKWLLLLSVVAAPLVVSADSEECTQIEQLCESRCLNPLEGTEEDTQIDTCLQTCEERANSCRTSAQ